MNSAQINQPMAESELNLNRRELGVGEQATGSTANQWNWFI